MSKRRRTRLTNVEKEALKRDLDAQEPVTELARKYGVSRRTIYNFKNRWGGRLPQSRSKVLTVRVSEEDMEHLDAFAQGLGLSRADTARRVLLYAAGIYHCAPAEVGEIEDLTKEVSAIGRNINQMVRAVNTEMRRSGRTTEPNRMLDKVSRQMQRISMANETVRSLMVRRAQQQRTHIGRIIEEMSGEEPNSQE